MQCHDSQQVQWHLQRLHRWGAFTVTYLSLRNKWHFNLGLNMSSEDNILILTCTSCQRTRAAMENSMSLWDFNESLLLSNYVDFLFLVNGWGSYLSSSSNRYGGASPFRHLYVSMNILKSIIFLSDSQYWRYMIIFLVLFVMIWAIVLNFLKLFLFDYPEGLSAMCFHIQSSLLVVNARMRLVAASNDRYSLILPITHTW